MILISYTFVNVFITLLWVVLRMCVWQKQRQISWRREAQLLLVYICIMVVARFTLFPFGKVDGAVQPLVFDGGNWFPFRINWIPFAMLMDYPEPRDAWLNLIGNTAMFVPLGIVWPGVLRKLDTHKKVLSAGFGVSLCIEIIQLPFFDRVSDVDDLILNTLGYAAGYGIYLLVRGIFRKMKN